MDIFIALGKRFETLKISRDPVEADKLLGWVAGDGLESLHETIAAELTEIKTAPPKTVTVSVRAFNKDTPINLEIFPYTTGTELRAAAAQAFEVPVDQTMLTVDVAPEVDYDETKIVALQRARNFVLKPAPESPVGSPAWYVDSAGVVNVPVELHDPALSRMIDVAVTAETRISEFRALISHWQVETAASGSDEPSFTPMSDLLINGREVPGRSNLNRILQEWQKNGFAKITARV